MVVGYGFLNADGGEDTIILQIARNVGSGYVSAHVVPRKGLAHLHSAAEMEKDLDRLGHGKVVLDRDNQPALRSLQEEFGSRRSHATVLENSGVAEWASSWCTEFQSPPANKARVHVRPGLHEQRTSSVPAEAWAYVTHHKVGNMVPSLKPKGEDTAPLQTSVRRASLCVRAKLRCIAKRNCTLPRVEPINGGSHEPLLVFLATPEDNAIQRQGLATSSSPTTPHNSSKP